MGKWKKWGEMMFYLPIGLAEHGPGTGPQYHVGGAKALLSGGGGGARPYT